LTGPPISPPASKATASPSEGDGFEFRFDAPAPFGVVELAYFPYFHATSAGQWIGNKILGIRVLDADSGGSLPYVRTFVRALMSYLSAAVLPRVLLDAVGPAEADLARHGRQQPGGQG
jgi:uncharacterized RDD family membrane protein YckC